MYICGQSQEFFVKIHFQYSRYHIKVVSTVKVVENVRFTHITECSKIIRAFQNFRILTLISTVVWSIFLRKNNIPLSKLWPWVLAPPENNCNYEWMYSEGKNDNSYISLFICNCYVRFSIVVVNNLRRNPL